MKLIYYVAFFLLIPVIMQPAAPGPLRHYNSIVASSLNITQDAINATLDARAIARNYIHNHAVGTAAVQTQARQELDGITLLYQQAAAEKRAMQNQADTILPGIGDLNQQAQTVMDITTTAKKIINDLEIIINKLYVIARPINTPANQQTMSTALIRQSRIVADLLATAHANIATAQRDLTKARAEQLIQNAYFSPEMQYTVLACVESPFRINLVTGKVQNLPKVQDIILYRQNDPNLKLDALHAAQEAVQIAILTAGLEVAYGQPSHWKFAPNLSSSFLMPPLDAPLNQELQRLQDTVNRAIALALNRRTWLQYGWSWIPSNLQDIVALNSRKTTSIDNSSVAVPAGIDYRNPNAPANIVTIPANLIRQIIKNFDYKQRNDPTDIAQLLFKQIFIAQQTVPTRGDNPMLQRCSNFTRPINATNYIFNNFINFENLIDQVVQSVQNATEDTIEQERLQAHEQFLQIRKAVQTAVYVANRNSNFYIGWLMPAAVTWMFDSALDQLITYDKRLSALCKDAEFGARPEDQIRDRVWTYTTLVIGGLAVAAAWHFGLGSSIGKLNPFGKNDIPPAPGPKETVSTVSAQPAAPNAQVTNTATLPKTEPVPGYNRLEESPGVTKAVNISEAQSDTPGSGTSTTIANFYTLITNATQPPAEAKKLVSTASNLTGAPTTSTKAAPSNAPTVTPGTEKKVTDSNPQTPDLLSKKKPSTAPKNDLETPAVTRPPVTGKSGSSDAKKPNQPTPNSVKKTVLPEKKILATSHSSTAKTTPQNNRPAVLPPVNLPSSKSYIQSGIDTVNALGLIGGVGYAAYQYSPTFAQGIHGVTENIKNVYNNWTQGPNPNKTTDQILTSLNIPAAGGPVDQNIDSVISTNSPGATPSQPEPNTSNTQQGSVNNPPANINGNN